MYEEIIETDVARHFYCEALHTSLVTRHIPRTYSQMPQSKRGNRQRHFPAYLNGKITNTRWRSFVVVITVALLEIEPKQVV